eukprot:COSAG02_NODE_17968_length_968_cov_1.388953_1_plen_86_part_10
MDSFNLHARSRGQNLLACLPIKQCLERIGGAYALSSFAAKYPSTSALYAASSPATAPSAAAAILLLHGQDDPKTLPLPPPPGPAQT